MTISIGFPERYNRTLVADRTILGCAKKAGQGGGEF